jgi:hypothetical protein
MTPAIAHELLRLPRRHPAEMRAIIAIAGWTQTLRRAGDTGPIRYSRLLTAKGVPAEDAVRVILAEARRVVGGLSSLSSGGSSAQRRREAEGEVEQHQGESGEVHGPIYAPGSPSRESER